LKLEQNWPKRREVESFFLASNSSGSCEPAEIYISVVLGETRERNSVTEQEKEEKGEEG
jgi:hypothetical protein